MIRSAPKAQTFWIDDQIAWEDLRFTAGYENTLDMPSCRPNLGPLLGRRSA